MALTVVMVMFRDVVDPELLNLIEFVVVFEVEFMAHLGLGVGVIFVQIAFLSNHGFELSLAKNSELFENAFFEIGLYSFQGVILLISILSIGVPVVNIIIIHKRIQRLELLISEVLSPWHILIYYYNLN